MSLTILEASKLGLGTEIQRAVIEIFAQSSPILLNLPFREIQGNALSYNQEKTLPGIAFRGLNEGYTESTGILNPVTESLKIAGGDVKVDKFIVDTEGEQQRAVHEAMKIKALAESWQSSFLKGDTDADPKDLDGLQNRVVGNQLVTQSAGACTLTKLDELIDTVMNPTHLIMNKTMRRRLSAAARSASVGGYITYDLDAFGRRVSFYNDIPILVVESADGQDTVLPFTEPSSTTSIYCVSFGPGMLEGIQNGAVDARDLGEQEATPTLLTRIEWYSAFTVYHGRAAGRYENITNVAVTA